MKDFILSLLFILCIAKCTGQTNEFAPVGAKWWYSYHTLTSDGVILLESAGDTLISDKTCRILHKTLISTDLSFPGSGIDTLNLNSEYVYEDSGSVYWYRYDNFYKLYDFWAEASESWEVASEYADGICDSTGFVVVTDTGSIVIAGIELRKLHIDTLPGYYIGFINNEVLERIGSLSYLFPGPLTIACGTDLPVISGYLRCYEDSILGIYSSGISEECDYVSSLNELINEGVLHIGPNPLRDQLNIFFKGPPYELFLYNEYSDLIFHNHVFAEAQQYDVSNIQKGIYVLKITYNNFSQTQKLIKL